jgi:hypothetical protein
MAEEGEEAAVTRVPASELDLPALWAPFWGTSWVSYARSLAEFQLYLKTLVSDPDAVDTLVSCSNCTIPAWGYSLLAYGNGRLACPACWNAWRECSRCASRLPGFTQVLDGNHVCLDCLGRHYQHCADCGGYYDAGDTHHHEHGDDLGSCCYSPLRAFSIRNDGDATLANNVRTTVALPGGVISAEGLEDIRAYLDYAGRRLLSRDLPALGNQWQTPAGNFAKRLSSLAYKKFGDKLAPADLSHVGSIARDHSNPVTVTIDVTRDLNRPPGDFYHRDSCWWSNYRESRCVLKTNGGFGLRTFDQWGSVSGRAWVMPLRRAGNGRLAPTFETLAPDAFAVFNGYGELEGYAAPRVMAHLAGWTYRKIGFSCSSMYVNNDSGYLVAPEDLATQYSGSRSLILSTRQHASLFAQEQAEKRDRAAA